MKTTTTTSRHLKVVPRNLGGRPTNDVAINNRIPAAEWIAKPADWSIEKFITEISEYLADIHGAVDFHNRHTIAMLAGHMDTYVKCTVAINEQGLLMRYNDGGTIGMNQYVNIRARAMPTIISLLNELGLTPKSRLSARARAGKSDMAKILRGPKS